MKHQQRWHLSRSLKPSRHWLWAFSLPLIVAPGALADQLPTDLNGWYQTHDGRVYKIHQRNRRVWLTRYEASSGTPLTHFKGRINAEANKIEGKIQSCTYSGTQFVYGAGEKPFTFTARNTGAQKSLGFTQADGKWIQFYPRNPLSNVDNSQGVCNLAKLAQSTWLVDQDRDTKLALYKIKNDPLSFWVYSLGYYNQYREGRWAKWPIARLDFRRIGNDQNPQESRSDTVFEVTHCYQGLNRDMQDKLFRHTSNRNITELVSLRRTDSRTFILKNIQSGGLLYKIYDRSEYPIRYDYWNRNTSSPEERIAFKIISGNTMQPKFLYRDATGRRVGAPFFDSTFFANPQTNAPAVQQCQYQI